MLLIVLTQCSTKLLVILFINLLFGFRPIGSMGLMQLMNRDLPELEFEFEKKLKDLIQKQ